MFLANFLVVLAISSYDVVSSAASNVASWNHPSIFNMPFYFVAARNKINKMQGKLAEHTFKMPPTALSLTQLRRHFQRKSLIHKTIVNAPLEQIVNAPLERMQAQLNDTRQLQERQLQDRVATSRKSEAINACQVSLG